jgi:ELWxxDGT repeat protein
MVIFNATNNNGRELWISDGTIEGTHSIIDLYPGEMDGVFGTGAIGGSFYMYNDSLIYFAGADGVNAMGEFVFELFVSDGTEEGTKIVSDLVVGTGGSNPGNFFEFGDRLYFAATDALVDREPFYINLGTTTSVDDVMSALSFSIAPYPNPLPRGSMLTVELKLNANTDIQAQLFDLTGRPVQNIQNLGHYQAGKRFIQFNPQHQVAGLYILKISTRESYVSMPIIMN